jgi:glycerol-3-phosphate dehydrogenase
VQTLLGDAQGLSAMGEQVVSGLYEIELHYLHQHEWARNADDVLWRRSKLGLHLSAAQRTAVAAWCATHWPGPANTTPASRATETAWN